MGLDGERLWKVHRRGPEKVNPPFQGYFKVIFVCGKQSVSVNGNEIIMPG